MDIIINDDSINQQYSEEEFREYCVMQLHPMLEKIETYKGRLLTEYNTYCKRITKEQSFLDIFKDNSDPLAIGIKIRLIQLINKGPYWNDDIKTSEEKAYRCLINTVPNCITETYERNGILLSFKDDRYSELEVKIVCDNIEETVRNINTVLMLDTHLEEMGYIIVWRQNSFMVNSLGYKFEIRSSETPHYSAHFHMSNADEDLEFSIPGAKLLEGKTRNQNAIVSWAQNNMDQIVGLWNRLHPEKPVKNWKY